MASLILSKFEFWVTLKNIDQISNLFIYHVQSIPSSWTGGNILCTDEPYIEYYNGHVLSKRLWELIWLPGLISYYLYTCTLSWVSHGVCLPAWSSSPLMLSDQSVSVTTKTLTVLFPHCWVSGFLVASCSISSPSLFCDVSPSSSFLLWKMHTPTSLRGWVFKIHFSLIHCLSIS